jgi:hypothetical protein
LSHIVAQSPGNDQLPDVARRVSFASLADGP